MYTINLVFDMVAKKTIYKKDENPKDFRLFVCFDVKSKLVVLVLRCSLVKESVNAFNLVL